MKCLSVSDKKGERIKQWNTIGMQVVFFLFSKNPLHPQVIDVYLLSTKELTQAII